MIETEKIKYCLYCGTGIGWEYKHGKDRPVCPKCGWIYFSDPRVAVAVLIEKDDKILLVRRAIDPGKGLWSLPAGFLDAGEDPEAAACRECMEEIGCEVEISQLINILPGHDHQRAADLVIFYLAKIVAGNPEPKDDVDDVAYFSRDNLPALAFTNTAKIIHEGIGIDILPNIQS